MKLSVFLLERHVLLDLCMNVLFQLLVLIPLAPFNAVDEEKEVHYEKYGEESSHISLVSLVGLYEVSLNFTQRIRNLNLLVLLATNLWSMSNHVG